MQSTSVQIKGSLLVLLLLFISPSKALAVNPIRWCLKTLGFLGETNLPSTIEPTTHSAPAFALKNPRETALIAALKTKGIDHRDIDSAFERGSGITTTELAAFEYAQYVFSSSPNPTVHVTIGPGFAFQRAWDSIKAGVVKDADPIQRDSAFHQKTFNLTIEVEPGTDLSTPEIRDFQAAVRYKYEERKAKVAVFASRRLEIPTEIGIALVNIE